MKLRTFIERPVLSAVISIVIVLVGLISIKTLPIEQFPDIAPPTVMVMTAYPGASAETVQKSVIAPLEEAINGVENMDYITSTATNSGNVEIMVYFRQGMDPDMAAVFVQNRVAQATGSLPAEVTRIGVSVIKRQNSMIKVIDLHATEESGYDTRFLANYSKINLEPQLKRIKGVGSVVLLSDQYSMRIWFNPAAMAHHHLIPSDVIGVLSEQNIESATGSFGESSGSTYEYIMKYSGRKQTPEEFGEMIIQALPSGEVLRLKDVARIELGVESYGYKSTTDGHPGVEMMIFQIAGSNATQVVNDIDALIEESRETMPDGLMIDTMMSVNDFLYASIKEVIKSLLHAILLVVLVVYFFLQDWKATLIPTISIFVSIIGTFAFLEVAGFTINLLTLFALVLAIGTVVDNAIVVVEAVQAKLEVGYHSSYHASVDAMDGISSAILTSTLVFMAVFIPVSMMGGTSGVFYTQSGITMAVAVGISAINSLTLAPALSAILLNPYIDENGKEIDNFSARFRKKFNTGFTAVVDKYKNGVKFFINRTWLVWILIVACCGLLVLFMITTKTGFVPDEDMGSIMVDIQATPGSSLQNTNDILMEVYERISSIEQIEICSTVSGFGLISGTGSSYGLITIKLKDWSLRPDKEDEVNAVIGQIMARTADIKDVNIVPMAPPMITGYGMTNGFELHMQDKMGGDIGEFFAVTVTVCSCGIYKKYERPAEMVTDSLFGARYQTADTSSIADLEWKELFTDPFLQDLIDSALVRNTDLKTAQLRVEQALTGLKISRLNYLPSVNFAPEGAVGGFNNFSDLNTGAGWTYTVPVAVGWDIDLFGKKTNAKRQAQASAAMAQDYEQAAQTGLKAGVAAQYYTLLMLDEQLRIAESTCEKFAESVRVLRAMMEAGMANDIAVSQMEGAWYQVETAVEDIRKSVNELENSLNITLCQTPRHIKRGVLTDASFPEKLQTGLPVSILSRRPDVRAAENNLAAAYYAVNAARADLYPSISLSGVAGWTNNLGGTVMDPAGMILNAAASLFQPIFNAGAMRGKVKIARADQKVAELTFQQTVLNAGAEVNDALTKYQTALSKEKWRTMQVESLSNALVKTEKMMQYTSTTYLEVLTAQQSLLQAETAQAQDTYEKISAVIELYRALGGGQQ